MPAPAPPVDIDQADHAEPSAAPPQPRPSPKANSYVRLASGQTARFARDSASSQPLAKWLDQLAAAPLPVLAVDGEQVRVAASDGSVELRVWVELNATQSLLERLTPLAARPGAPPSAWLAAGAVVDMAVEDEGMLRVFVRLDALSTSFAIEGYAPADALGHQFVEERPNPVANPRSMLDIPMYGTLEILAVPHGDRIAVVHQGILQVDVAALHPPRDGFQRIQLTVESEEQLVDARVDGYVSVDSVVAQPPVESATILEAPATVALEAGPRLASAGRCLHETPGGAVVGRITASVHTLDTEPPTLRLGDLLLYVGNDNCAAW